MDDNEDAKKITETLYQHNLEITAKNKTLSLLEKLYKTSILTLTPEVMAKDVSDTIRQELNMEFAGIIIFDETTDSLLPLAFSRSERMLQNLTNKSSSHLEDFKIKGVIDDPIFRKVVYDKEEYKTNDLGEVLGNLVDKETLEKIKQEAHIKTVLLYPLKTGDAVFGVLIFGLNRDYDTLSVFEKESIKSLINIVALSLNKVFLYKEVQDANVSLRDLVKQRESLTHLITHKVKGSFTHSKYIFAEMLEGTFGVISPELQKMAKNGLESDNNGIYTVDLILNADNLTHGIIKYNMQLFNFKEMLEKVISNKQGPIESKGLKLETDIKNADYNILGDENWLKEAIGNLIENSYRYTKEGKITIGLEKKDNKILFSVKDSGVGINEDDKKNLFTEGGRGANSVKVNVDSTGYGLYTVRLVVEAHKGRVWGESEGAGKGAQFYVELPVA